MGTPVHGDLGSDLVNRRKALLSPDSESLRLRPYRRSLALLALFIAVPPAGYNGAFWIIFIDLTEGFAETGYMQAFSDAYATRHRSQVDE